MNAAERFNQLLSDQDRQVFAASGYGERGGLGSRPAVIVIDVNYAFCGHQREPVLESQRHWPNSCGEAAWDALPHIRRLVDAAHDRHVPVFYTTGQDRRPDLFDAGRWKAKNPRMRENMDASAPPVESIPGFPRNNIVASIAPSPQDVLIRKPKPSAFFGTALTGYLIDLGIDTLLLAGVATSGCVRATAVDGFSFNYSVAVIEDACFDRIEASHRMALFDLQSTYADVYRTDEMVRYLDNVPMSQFDSKIAFPAEVQS